MTPAASATLDHPLPGEAWSAGKTFLLSAAFWLAVSSAVALQVSALGVFPWATAFTLSLLDWGPWILLTPITLWLAHRLPIGPGTWRWTILLHLLAALALVTLTESAMSALSLRKELLAPPPGRERGRDPDRESRPRREDRGPGGPHSPWFRLFDRARMGVPIYWMLVAAAHARAHQRRSLERERRALLAEAHLAEARLAALQAQLNPHFLFNTLNTIAELVYENPPAAEATITSLSDLLRAALAAQQRREVPLREEIKLVERYGAIQQMRFTDRLEVRYEIDPAALDLAVPTLLLQPLVENAVIHGVAPGRTRGTVFVRARATADRLELSVADTGPGRGAPAGGEGAELRFTEGVGLGNTRARLAALYGEQHRLTLGRAAEGGVSVTIEIPRREASRK